MPEVTEILEAIGRGQPQAADELLSAVYDDLRRLARAQLSREKPGQTLQATALVHEAWLRLIGTGASSSQWSHRGHFFAAVAEAMRRILIEQSRRKLAAKRGGSAGRVALDEHLAIALEDAHSADELLSLDEAIRELATVNPGAAEFVKLRFFAGLSLAEAAEMTGLPLATAKRRWTYGRAWLYGRLKAETAQPRLPE